MIESRDTLEFIAQLHKKTLCWYILKTLIRKASTQDSKGNIDSKFDCVNEVLPKTREETQRQPPEPEVLMMQNRQSEPGVLKASSSIEAVNLDSWPNSSTTSPDNQEMPGKYATFFVTPRKILDLNYSGRIIFSTGCRFIEVDT